MSFMKKLIFFIELLLKYIYLTYNNITFILIINFFYNRVECSIFHKLSLISFVKISKEIVIVLSLSLLMLHLSLSACVVISFFQTLIN